MEYDFTVSFAKHFSSLKDPRINRKKLYPLTEILFVVIYGAESCRDFVISGTEKNKFPKKLFSI